MALTPNPSSRYLRASLTGLIGGVLLAVAVTTGEFLLSALRVWAQVANCTATANVCFGYAQVGGVGIPIAFIVGFVAAFVWFLRRRRHRVGA